MKKYVLIFIGLLSLLLPTLVSAHSFGTIYSLPVPFWMYAYGAIAAMLVSFLFIGYFFDKKQEDFSYSTFNLSKFKFFNYIQKDWFLRILKILSIILFLFTIITGLIGDDTAYTNFNMTFFWIIFVLGLTYLSALIGDIYSVVNPWKIITDWLVGKKAEPLIKYPKSFGYYPALLFYFLFIWIELVGQNTPFKLSVILLVYTIVNDFGVMAFGREIWFHYCELFSVFFRLISKISPIEYKEGKLYLRAPFVGLLKEPAEHFSLVLFTLFMLSSTAFDGFKETLPWSKLYWGYIDDFVRPFLGTASYPIFETIGLFLSPFIFLAIYLLLIYAAKKIARSSLSLKDLSFKFALSLVPIALVYNIAHYYTLVFTEGPGILRLISDPFGFGWNLFGTINRFNGVILPANFVWHSQVFFILAGHIAAVYLTHIQALNAFPNNKRAFWSQFPMLILMIAYTVLGLWILSEPLTTGAL